MSFVVGLSPPDVPDARLAGVTVIVQGATGQRPEVDEGEVVVVEDGGITVVCADGRFKITRVQPADGKKIDAGEWAKSVNLAKGTILS